MAFETFDYQNAEFTSEACRASIAAIGCSELSKNNLSNFDMSLCVTAGNARYDDFRTFARLVKAFLLMLPLLICGGSVLLRFGPDISRHWQCLPIIGVHALGVAVIVIGLIGIFSASLVEYRLGQYFITRRRMVKTRDWDMVVGIEDAHTFTKLKLTKDDVALLYADPVNKLIRLEGIRYRYLIRAEDVAELKRIAYQNAPATVITYRVADSDVNLSIAVTRITPMTALRRSGNQTNLPPVDQLLEKTFSMQIADGMQRQAGDLTA